MKKFILLFIAITVISCSVDPVEEVDQELNLNLQKDSIIDTIDQFHDSMRWFSFLTTKTLATNSIARNEFQNLHAIYGNAIPVDVLIGSNTQAPTFNSTWEAMLSDYIVTDLLNDYTISDSGRPNGADGRPRPKGTAGVALPVNGIFSQPTDPPGVTNNIITTDSFIAYLTIYNCTELYLPRPLNLSKGVSYFSTAHPLTSNNSTDGVRINQFNTSSGFPSSGFPEPSYELYYESDYIDDSSIDLNNVFVTRPYRVLDPKVRSCDYSFIPVQDFTIFLD